MPTFIAEISIVLNAKFNFRFPKGYSHTPKMSRVGYLALATSLVNFDVLGKGRAQEQ